MESREYEPAGPIQDALLLAGAVVVAGGLAFFLLPLTTHTAGAARSAHIQWQSRKGEIEQAIAECNESGPSDTDADTEPRDN